MMMIAKEKTNEVVFTHWWLSTDTNFVLNSPLHTDVKNNCKQYDCFSWCWWYQWYWCWWRIYLSPKSGSYSPHMMGGEVGGQKAVASRLSENNPQVDHPDRWSGWSRGRKMMAMSVEMQIWQIYLFPGSRTGTMSSLLFRLHCISSVLSEQYYKQAPWS